MLYWPGHYERFTPDVGVVNDGTTILGRRSQPQPDAALRILTGGQARLTEAGSVRGGPELVVEIANSTEAYDLHATRRDYDRYGAKEYLAVVVRTPRPVGFARLGGRLAEIVLDADGVLRSGTFPGLWLDPAALLAGDFNRLAQVVEQGVATAAHAAFVADLRSRTA